MAPKVRLVVVRATRFQTEVSSDGPLVSDLGCSDQSGGGRERREAPSHQAVLGNRGEAFCGADRKVRDLRFIDDLEPAQLWNLLESDQRMRREEAVLHIRHQI